MPMSKTVCPIVARVAGALALAIAAAAPSGALAMDAEAFRATVVQNLSNGVGVGDGLVSDTDNTAVRLDRNAERMVEESQDLTILSVEAGAVDRSTGATRIVIQAESRDGRHLRLLGSAYREVDALAPSRAVAPGEPIADALIPTRVAAGRADGLLRPGTNLGDLIARRRLPEGVPVRARDTVLRPVVARNSIVTLVWENGGIALTAQGKAMSDGASGARIRVLNTDSRKTLEAVVIDSQTVSVSQP